MKPFLRSRRRKKNQFLRPPFWPKILKRGGGSIGPMKSLQKSREEGLLAQFCQSIFWHTEKNMFFQVSKMDLEPQFWGRGGRVSPEKCVKMTSITFFTWRNFRIRAIFEAFWADLVKANFFGAVPGSPTHWDTWNFQGVPGTTYLPGQVFSITDLDENSA